MLFYRILVSLQVYPKPNGGQTPSFYPDLFISAGVEVVDLIQVYSGMQSKPFKQSMRNTEGIF